MMREGEISRMIRLADKSDIPYICAIYERIHKYEELGQMSVGWIRGVYPTVSTAQNALRRGDMFVEIYNGQVVASGVINKEQVCDYARCNWKFKADNDEVMVLHTLTVDPDKRGRGYAKHFVDFYEQYAKECGCCVLRIDTQEKNIVARKMYAKLGFSEAGIVSCDFNGINDVKLVCLEKKI